VLRVADCSLKVRSLSLTALVLSIALLPFSLGLAVNDHNRHQAAAEREMDDGAGTHASTLAASLDRARTVTLIMAHNAAFRGFYLEPGSRASKLRRSTFIDGANDALVYLESLFPSQIGELCFIDRSGSENARVVHGQRAPVSDLSPDEADNPFFRPTFALRPGQVFQSRPYVSPDTHDWVIGNATPIPLGAQRSSVAIVHYELSVESFRRQLRTDDGDGYDVSLVDARTGRVIIDGSRPQRVGAPLGVPGDRRFAALARHPRKQGVTAIGGHIAAYRHLRAGAGNANDWILVATASKPFPGLIAGLGAAPLAMLAVALVLMALAAVALRASRRELQSAATTDALTGLPNRRRLFADLERSTARGDDALLLLFDLDGFKSYNDTFGHLAGDALLARLGHALARAVEGRGRAYRLGGDEFCVLARAEGRAQLELAATAALSEHGDGFAVSASYGAVAIPAEASLAEDAMRLADQRMYAQKTSARASAGRQSTDVLLRVLAERHPDLEGHLDGVSRHAVAVGQRLGLDDEALDQLRLAAELHDVGKVAIPDAIIHKAGPLDESEWAFMRRHTLIGERIVAAAPALGPVAKLVRASHERWDGTGYPDATPGHDIALGARIIAVCDAYDAMVSDRPYRRGRSAPVAVDELRRCAGTQFDPAVVDAFVAELAAQPLRSSVTSA
jgi:diguanylate cyclase (GGDEF)-like protein